MLKCYKRVLSPCRQSNTIYNCWIADNYIKKKNYHQIYDAREYFLSVFTISPSDDRIRTSVRINPTRITRQACINPAVSRSTQGFCSLSYNLFCSFLIFPSSTENSSAREIQQWRAQLQEQELDQGSRARRSFPRGVRLLDPPVVVSK